LLKCSVVVIKLKNFMVYRDATLHPGPSLNFIIGPNGSGKSSIISAMCLGLGGSTKDMRRATELAGFIRNGSLGAEIMVRRRPPFRRRPPRRTSARAGWAAIVTE